jgi:NADPH:quinone reductase-like Zn-dependent oxidoreductase
MEYPMKRVVVRQFGDVDQLDVLDEPTPQPGRGQVLVRRTSIGMNHADLMARRGEYRLSSGDPPFTPGLEGGGVIEAVGADVSDRRAGQRVVLSPDAPRLAAAGRGGTYRTHYLCAAAQTVPAPDALPDDQLGAVWLPYLTAWGCLVWKQKLQPGQIVALPAASSSVALAAAQIVKSLGGQAIGLTTRLDKKQRIEALDTARYDHVIITRNEAGGDLPWHREFKAITDGHGVDVFFDPVAAGDYLNTEIRCLAQHGVIWVYGLLGEAGVVDVTPLIRKYAAIRGWVLNELIREGGEAVTDGCRWILDRFADGTFRQHVDHAFGLDHVRHAHTVMQRGAHVGKLVLVP